MNSLRLVFNGVPIAKKRARFRVVQTKNYPIVYKDPGEKKAESIVKGEMSKQALKLGYSPKYPLFDSSWIISFQATYTLPWPKSFNTYKKNKYTFDSAPTCKPDLDNLTKFYMDCATGIIWEDDRCVASAKEQKVWGDIPSTKITITARKRLAMDETTEVVASFLNISKINELIYDARELAFQNGLISEEMVEEVDLAQRQDMFTKISHLVAKMADSYGESLAKISKQLAKIKEVKK